MALKLQILQDKRFSCHNCGNCCRHWHVQLLDDEIDRIAQLRWPQDDPLGGQIINIKHRDQIFLTHKDNGDCIFLNDANGLCRIHEQFGEAAKPLGCQLYPFQLHRTFGNEVAIIPRHDCPSVRKNLGDHYKAKQLKKMADQLIADQSPFSEQQRCMLKQDQIQAIVDFLETLLPGLKSPTHKAVFLFSFCDWLSHQHPPELSRESLGQLYAPLVEHVDELVDQAKSKKLRRVDRFAFANLVAMYLRRDEDILDKRVSRSKRAINILLFGIGMTTANDLGTNFPNQAGNSRKLFDMPLADTLDLAPLDQLVKTRLQTFGFMGYGNLDLDLLDGLRSLCLIYPLVMGASKIFSSAEEPVDFSIGAIDHAFGRTAILRTTAAKRIIRQLFNPDTFVKLMVNL